MASENHMIADVIADRISKLMAVFDIFREEVDGQASVHGSVINGLVTEYSDVDVNASMSVSMIYRIASKSKSFAVMEYLPNLRIPRVLLKHNATKVVVDVVHGTIVEDAMKKAEIFRRIASVDLYRDYALLIKNWMKSQELRMPVKNGYLNSFNMLLIAFFYLMNRPKKQLLPLWDDITEELVKKFAEEAKESHELPTAKFLFKEFLEFLVKKVKLVRCVLTKHVDITNVEAGGIWGMYRKSWYVEDPVTFKNVADFRYEQESVILKIAQSKLDSL